MDVRDVAAVAVRALKEGHSSRAYDLTGALALDYEQVADALSVTLGRQIRYTNPSPLKFVRVSLERGVAVGFALFMLAEYTLARVGLAGRVTRTVQEVLGRAPISLRRFAEDHRAVWTKGESRP